MKLYALISDNDYSSEARKAKLTHYSIREYSSTSVYSFICGRTLKANVHKVKLITDPSQIATCKRCLERAAKRVMLGKEDKPEPYTVDFETYNNADLALSNQTIIEGLSNEDQ